MFLVFIFPIIVVNLFTAVINGAFGEARRCENEAALALQKTMPHVADESRRTKATDVEIAQPEFQRSYSTLCADEAGVPVEVMQELLGREGRDKSGHVRRISMAINPLSVTSPGGFGINGMDKSPGE